jgi:hypothetical protein
VNGKKSTIKAASQPIADVALKIEAGERTTRQWQKN